MESDKSQKSKYVWYPGHIAHTRQKIKTHIFKANLIVEVLDCRIPLTSRSYLLEDNLKQKPRIVLLNKSDLADPEKTNQWVKHLYQEGVLKVIPCCSTQGGGRKVLKIITKIKPELKKVLLNHKIIVIGIPNVGKSRFINSLLGIKKVKVENRPGVTRGPQWINIGDGYELMDLPGVLAPSVVDDEAAIKLALCNSMSRDVIDIEICIKYLVKLIKDNMRCVSRKHPFIKALIENEEDAVEKYAENLNFIIKGGKPDTDRAMKKILKDLDKGLLGKFVFDEIPVETDEENSDED